MNSKNENGLSFTGAKIIIVPQDDTTTTTTTTKTDEDNFFQCSSSLSKPQEGMTSIRSESDIMIAREKVQVKSALRLKSGRSNIPDHLRSSSMSCSDKICRWIVMGLQGCGTLARFLPKYIRLSSIVVSRDPRIATFGDGLDPQHIALERAIISRVKGVISAFKSAKIDDCREGYMEIKIPTVHISDSIFPQGKASIEKQRTDKSDIISTDKNKPVSDEQTCLHDKKENGYIQTNNKRSVGSSDFDHNEKKPKRHKGQQKISSCGVSLNWQQNSLLDDKTRKDNDIEQTVGAKGIIQRKKPKCSNDIIKCASRLSRYSIWNQTHEALSLSGGGNDDPMKRLPKQTISYQQLKELYAPQGTRKSMSFVFRDSKSPLQGWVKSSSDGDFIPH